MKPQTGQFFLTDEFGQIWELRPTGDRACPVDIVLYLRGGECDQCGAKRADYPGYLGEGCPTYPYGSCDGTMR